MFVIPPTTETFIATAMIRRRKRLRAGTSVKFCEIDRKVGDWFERTVEEPVAKPMPLESTLTSNSLNAAELAELIGSDEKVDVPLSRIYALLELHEQGMPTGLLTNEWPNIFFARDSKGIRRLLDLRREANGWRLVGREMESARRFYAGVKVFFRA